MLRSLLSGGSGYGAVGGNNGAKPLPVPTPTPPPPCAVVSGSLYCAPTSDTAAQKVVYLTCTASVRTGDAPFSSELRVTRDVGEDGEADGDLPEVLVFGLDAGARFDVDDLRFSWCDRAGKKRYALDVDDADEAAGLREAVCRALWEKMNGEASTGVGMEELEKVLKKREEVRPSDLLRASGELVRADAELYIYDTAAECFKCRIQEAVVTINSAVAAEDGRRAFLFMVFEKGSGAAVVECEVDNSMSAQFFAQTTSLVWVVTTMADTDVDAIAEGEFDPTSQVCMSLKFHDADSFCRMQNQYAVCLYEVNNQVTMESMKLKDEDRAYIMASANEDYAPMEFVSDDESTREEDEEDASRMLQDDRPEARASLGGAADGFTNSQLAVAFNNDRTFVVRGDKLGVLSHAGRDGVEHRTTVTFADPEKLGATFKPSKILLHEKDSSMLVLDEADPTRVMRMDLERGEVVEQWGGNLTGGTDFRSLTLTEKYANLTHNQEFMGLNKNQLLRMDPRSKEFIVQSKKYAAGTRARLEAFATTGAGYIATASENGDIRMFDAVGKNAKTHLPGLGDRVRGIDVTEDGNFVLATTEKYLLVIDTRVKGETKSGFQKSMGKNKPQPIKLVVSPQDRAKHRIGEISFTTAHFNTGASLERSIVTSTGPFIVTWNFRAVKQGKKDAYQIKRFKDSIVADQFAYGNDGKIVITLPNDVTLNSFTPVRRNRRSSSGGGGRA
jgi:VID27 C-terminal WD40-like domain/VID27 PH-like domain